jgi:para-aminobenzoate synthetase component 1
MIRKNVQKELKNPYTHFQISMKKQTANISGLVHTLRNEGDVVLLESQMKGHPSSNQSYLAAQPKAWIKASGENIEIWEEGFQETKKGNPWDALSAFREKHQDWLFGYFGYDLKNHIEDLGSGNEKLNSAPDLYFMVPELIIEIDADEQLRAIKGGIPEIGDSDISRKDVFVKLRNRISKAKYIELVKKAKSDIYEGEYYEINLSHPLEFDIEGDSWDLYQAMKKVGPVPFGGYANIGDIAICCSSPERFLAREGGKIWSQPIKGTALRKEDVDSVKDIERLKGSEKERAENLMIVDLVRNDLGRVAQRNSVHVSNLFEVQSFETVHQMVSTVEAKVEEKIESIDVIKNCFPMGSMTGAPKIAAMKSIEHYENYRRGIYSGALGYIKPDGDFDFNVIIRTAIIEGDKLVYPVGGAITSDSNPKEEWEETLIKARAITNIFQNIKKPE